MININIWNDYLFKIEPMKMTLISPSVQEERRPHVHTGSCESCLRFNVICNLQSAEGTKTSVSERGRQREWRNERGLALHISRTCTFLSGRPLLHSNVKWEKLLCLRSREQNLTWARFIYERVICHWGFVLQLNKGEKLYETDLPGWPGENAENFANATSFQSDHNSLLALNFSVNYGLLQENLNVSL